MPAKVPSIPGFGKDPESMFQAVQAMAEILRGHGLAGAELSISVREDGLEVRMGAVESDDLPKDGSEAMTGTLVFTDSAPANRTIPAGQTAFHPNLTIPSGKTYTVDSGAGLHVSLALVVDGTLISNGLTYVR